MADFEEYRFSFSDALFLRHSSLPLHSLKNYFFADYLVNVVHFPYTPLHTGRLLIAALALSVKQMYEKQPSKALPPARRRPRQ